MNNSDPDPNRIKPVLVYEKGQRCLMKLSFSCIRIRHADFKQDVCFPLEGEYDI